jgi:sulfur carrier protein
MEITLNGKTIVSSAPTLADLVTEQGIDPKALVAEVNLNVIPQDKWRSLVLHDGDRVELLSFVGGG